FNLVLVARNEGRLQQVAAELAQRHRIRTLPLPQDLAEAGAATKIFAACADKAVSVLVNNAGFGAQESFAESDLQNNLAMMHTNMDALVQLSHLFLQPMLARREGRILSVASTAAFPSCSPA